MMLIGKVLEYDGRSGIIIDENANKYLLLNQDIYDEDIKTGDYVKFEKEVFKKTYEDSLIARYVKKI